MPTADGGSFYGAASAPGRRRDGLAAVAVVLVVVAIAVAIAKPWGDTGLPVASGSPAVAAVTPSAAPSHSSAPSAPSALPSYPPRPQAVAFTTAPPPGSDSWAGLDWRRLAPDDPLGIVRTEATLGETSVAIGDIRGTTSTTVWASTDRSHWEPLDGGTLASRWSGLTVVGVATLAGKFVALTEMNDYLYRYLRPSGSGRPPTDGAGAKRPRCRSMRS